jgi:two-component sensor histidine kinase
VKKNYIVIVLLLLLYKSYGNSVAFNVYSILDYNNTSFSAIKSESFNKELNGDNLSYGFSNATLWLKIELKNKLPEKAILDIDYPLLDYVTCYYKNNGQWHSVQFGDRVKGWNKKYNTVSLYTDLPPNIGNIIYLKIKSESSLTIPLKIKSLEDFYYTSSNNMIFYFLYYGFLIIMFIYNFFLYISLKSKSYLIYCLTILCTLLYQGNYNGHSQFYFWGDYTTWSNISMPLFMGATTLFSAEFAVSFLNLKTNKKLHIFVRLVSIFGIAVVFASCFASYRIAIIMATLGTIIGSVILFLTGIISWSNKVKIAPFYTIAWSIYLFFLILGALRAFGLVSTNYYTYKSSHFGSALELIFLAFALAHKYKIINKEKIEIQEQLYNTKHQLTLKLEERVKERTDELQNALNDKDILLSEVHHRVKNNLQLITSLLNLHIRKLSDLNSKEVLTESKRRIEVMADLHEQLYAGNSDFNLLEVEDYLNRFILLIKQSHTGKDINIELDSHTESNISFDKTILLSLILNEIISNSIKHGFKNQTTGKISISISQLNKDFVINVIDNGKGLPSSFSLNNNGALGTRIIEALSKQLNGEFNIKNRALPTKGVINNLKFCID